MKKVSTVATKPSRTVGREPLRFNFRRTQCSVSSPMWRYAWLAASGQSNALLPRLNQLNEAVRLSVIESKWRPLEKNGTAILLV